MWFRFPEGCERISVQLQEFTVEVKDKDGRGCFRAPAHFAPIILGQKGFSQLTDIPAGAPEDLPAQDPLRDGAIHDLSGKVTTLEGRVSDLVSDLASKDAALKAMIVERDTLVVRCQALQAKLDELEDEDEVAPPPPAPAPIKATPKA